MQKYSFYNDYSEGAHPLILEALTSTNLDQEAGYGQDRFSLEAQNLIRTAIKNSDADVHFVTGGTQANAIVIDAMLKPYEAVIAVNSAHINVHEAGAIEATGHKICIAEANDGKLTTNLIGQVLQLHVDEHMVRPKMVFLSQPTELGTIYTKAELIAIAEYCRSKELYLYVDGARLSSALVSRESDLSLSDIAGLVDAFYVGGTKNGAFMGEAIVILNPKLKNNFRYYLKQHGALLAKGRLLGIQFLTLFTNNLFLELAKHANNLAGELAKGIADLGYKFLVESTTNQIFPILPNEVIEKLKHLYGFYEWQKVDESSSAIRLVTSWATKESMVSEFLKDLATMSSVD